MSINIANSRKISRGLAKALIELEKNKEGKNTEVSRALLRYLSILGGVTVLDCYEEEELSNILRKKGRELIIQSDSGKKINYKEKP